MEAINRYIETARFIKKYKAEPVYMSKFSRDFVNGMIEFFKIPEDVGDCENCRVVDWVEANDISGYLSLGNESYLKQVAAFKNGRKFRKKCKTC